jgi:hypothetical protein
VNVAHGPKKPPPDNAGSTRHGACGDASAPGSRWNCRGSTMRTGPIAPAASIAHGRKRGSARRKADPQRYPRHATRGDHVDAFGVIMPIGFPRPGFRGRAAKRIFAMGVGRVAMYGVDVGRDRVSVVVPTCDAMRRA